MARRDPKDGPHLIYVPERVFDTDRFLDDVEQVYSQNGRCVIALSEGIVSADGRPVLMTLQGETEAGPVRQHAALGPRHPGRRPLATRSSSASRSSGCAATPSATCSAPSWASSPRWTSSEARDVGETAVHFASSRDMNGSVAIRRTGDYSVDYFLTPLDTVARDTKPLPPEFLKGEPRHRRELPLLRPAAHRRHPPLRPDHRPPRGARLERNRHAARPPRPRPVAPPSAWAPRKLLP